MLHTGEDGGPEETVEAARHGLLAAVRSLVTDVFLPTIETQTRCWNSDGQQNSCCANTELVNSLNSFARVLAGMSCADFSTVICLLL